MSRRHAAAVLATGLLWGAAAEAQDLSFNLINAASEDLVGFYVSPASTDDWEDNLLTGGYLPPDHEIGVLIADGLATCVYDIRGEFADESIAEDYELDLCELGEYTFTD